MMLVRFSEYVLVDEDGALHLRVDPDNPLGVQSDVDELVKGDDGRNACEETN